MRRWLFSLLLLILIAVGAYRWQRLNGEGGGTRVPERYTPAEGPRIDPKDTQVLAAMDAEYSRLINAVVPSVVSITSSRTLRQRPQIFDPLEFLLNRRNRAPQSREQSSLGSGVIVSREGHILTNNHVIADMQKIEVQLTDGRMEPAQLIGSDEQTDIAVLKINAKNIEPLPFGDSDQVRVGQMVFAIGNPFGLQETVTQGIISAKGRRAVIDSGVEFLQTDAAVNQGNSGGPLLNLRGEIVGINSAIYANSNEGGWLGISFAIPSNTARRTLESLLKSGRVVRGYLGVQMTNLTREVARDLGLPDTAGALITDIVPGSPADGAGLQPGDLIRSYNGRALPDILALRTRLAETELNAKVQLGILRAGQPMTLTAEIVEAPSDIGLSRLPAPSSSPTPRLPNAGHPLASVQVAEIPGGLRAGLPEGVNGLVVTGIQPGSAAAEKLQVGDIIEEINERPLRNVEAFERFVRALPRGQKTLLLIFRGQTRSFLIVP